MEKQPPGALGKLLLIPNPVIPKWLGLVGLDTSLFVWNLGIGCLNFAPWVMCLGSLVPLPEQQIPGGNGSTSAGLEALQQRRGFVRK